MTIASLLGNAVLRIGSEGPLVRDAQLALATLGYHLKGTGYFGNATDVAVTDFQKSRGIPANGRIDAITADALDVANKGGGPGGRAIPPETNRPLWLIAALSLVGTKEMKGAGDNPVILNWAKGQGGDVAKSYTHDSIPWCALFANQALAQAGLKGTGTLWALDFAHWGVALKGPVVGAFAPMSRNGGGHIPIVVGRDQHGNLMCVGGNQSDAVNIKPFDPDRVVAYRWPCDVAAPWKVGFDSLPLVNSDGKVSRNEA